MVPPADAGILACPPFVAVHRGTDEVKVTPNVEVHRMAVSRTHACRVVPEGEHGTHRPYRPSRLRQPWQQQHQQDETFCPSYASETSGILTEWTPSHYWMTLSCLGRAWRIPAAAA